MPQFEKEWDQFIEWLQKAKRDIGDTVVPVVAICLQAKRVEGSDTEVDVFHEKDVTCLWAPDVPESERGPFLEQLGRDYTPRNVLNSKDVT